MKINNNFFGIILFTVMLISACQKIAQNEGVALLNAEKHSEMTKAENMIAEEHIKEFEKICKDRTPDNWMDMRPMKNGEFTSEQSCWGCMSDDGMSHFCTMEEYKEYLHYE